MKTSLLLSFVVLHYFTSLAQGTIDTTDIVTSYEESGSYISKWYHLKNQNHYESKVNLSSPHEIYGEVSLSEDSREILSAIIHNNLSKETVSSLSGKKVILSLIVNNLGHITSVMIGVRKEDSVQVIFTKQECKKLIQDIKKDVRFDVVYEFENKNGHLSMIVPVEIK